MKTLDSVLDESQPARSLDALRGRIHNATHTIRELEAEVERLRAALLDARARGDWYKYNGEYAWDAVHDFLRRQYTDPARAKLADEGLLPPA